MNRDDYRAALDRIELSEGFRQDTIQKLTRAAGQQTKKETVFMKPRRTFKTGLLAAALAVALIVSAAAAVYLLTPKDVAAHNDDPVLADAFAGGGAILSNQTAESDGYTFTLGGLVSGAGISKYAQDVDAARTYAVVSVARTDGTPLENLDAPFHLSPLVAGFQPHMVNAWTLGGGYTSFLSGGVAYYLFDCESLEIFADHTVYLAVGQELSAGSDTFAMAEDGAISFVEGYEGPHALFTLPLDASKADSAAVDQFLKDTGLMP